MGKAGGSCLKFEISATRRDEFDEIMAMTKRAAVFDETEVYTVTELLEGYEEGPEESGYYFLSCREAGQIIGYACWGPRQLSGNGYDLYWICADPAVHSKGVGRALMQRRRRRNQQAERRVGGDRNVGHRSLCARPTVV